MKEYIIVEHPDFPYKDPKPKELVRCKDCKFKYCSNTLEVYKVPDDQLWCSEVDTDPDDYCSMGERRGNTETVEAIPVEWLEDYVMGEYKDVSNYVYTMIDNWRKENGL